MSDLEITKRRADDEVESERMESMKRPKMDCSGPDEDVGCAPEGSSAGDDANNEYGVITELEGGSNTTDGDGSTHKAELRASVSSAPMEAQIAPANDSTTNTKNAVAAAAAEIDIHTTVPTVTAASPSAASADDLICLEDLPPELPSLVLDGKDPLMKPQCRLPTSGSTKSASIEENVESHYPFLMELNTAMFDHLGESFLTRTLDDHRADMSPHIQSASYGPHDLSKVDIVIINLVDDRLGGLTPSYILVPNQTDPRSIYRSDHEPFRLYLRHGPSEHVVMQEHLHNNEYRTRLRYVFQILEMAVYSSIFDVFTPTLSQASSGFKFRRAIGATNQSKASPTAPPAILDFEPGMLSKHMFDLWVSKAERHRFTCLIYRFQFSCQIAGYEELNEFWLDDGTSLTTKDRNNIAHWRALFKTIPRLNLRSDVRELLETVEQCTNTDDIFSCPFAPYIDSDVATLEKELNEFVKDWRDYCGKRSPGAPDLESPSKQTIEAFILARSAKLHRTDTERPA